jgi:ParB-like chromosome segregation protein Spo0J
MSRLLQPIVVNEDRLLLAGVQRLAACKHLGWETVPVIVRCVA